MFSFNRKSCESISRFSLHFVNPSSPNCTIWHKIWGFIFRIAETVYKCIDNIDTTAYGQKKMNTQIKLDIEKVREFVGDFDKLFENLVKAYIEDAEQLKTCKESFMKKYPKIFRDFSKNEVEMDIDIDTTMETKATIDREETKEC